MNYANVALTAHYSTNCSQFFIDLVLAGASRSRRHDEAMIPMHDGVTRLAFSCLNNSYVLIQVIS